MGGPGRNTASGIAAAGADGVGLLAGLPDPIHDAQAVFRLLMMALAEPCQVRGLEAKLLVEAPSPLGPVAAACALTLLDFETPVFLDAPLRDAPDVAAFLKFHTGAPITDDPTQAHFAMICDVARAPALAGFAQGTAEYPDRSTTLFIQVDDWGDGDGTDGRLWFEGPGLAEAKPLAAAGQIPDFAEQWLQNRAGFPLGVDLVFVTATALAGLPRSSRLMGA